MSKFIFLAGKVILVATSSAIAVPYSIAMASNLMYGWPEDEDKYRRALAPRKVLSLNYSLFSNMLDNFKNTNHRRKALHFYKMANNNRLIRNLVYGCNSNCMDLYFPTFCRSGPKNPVVVYLYGNNWGQITKEEHSTVCANLADSLNAIICIPNYSTFPKGYIDDMIQDVADCLNWLRLYGEQYGIDKNKIVLLGQESGAHICVMTILELTLKRLLYDPLSLSLPNSNFGATSFEVLSDPASYRRNHSLNSNNSKISSPSENNCFLDSLNFKSKYFSETSDNYSDSNKNCKSSPFSSLTLDTLEDHSENLDALHPIASVQNSNFNKSNFASCTSSFIILHENGNGNGKSSIEESNNSSEVEKDVNVDEGKTDDDIAEKNLNSSEESDAIDTHSGLVCSPTIEETKKTIYEENLNEKESENSLENKCVPSDTDQSKNESDEIIQCTKDDHPIIKELTSSQAECCDVLDSIIGIVGVSGIYNISDHYDYEYHCGVEDIMVTSKVMYSKENFDRFSPTEIIPNLPSHTRLPLFSLIYGRNDEKTPSVSSEKMEFVLKGYDDGIVTSHCIPFANHLDVTNSIMDDSYNDLLRTLQNNILLFIND